MQPRAIHGQALLSPWYLGNNDSRGMLLQVLKFKTKTTAEVGHCLIRIDSNGPQATLILFVPNDNVSNVPDMSV
jgi:hypothetical protein